MTELAAKTLENRGFKTHEIVKIMKISQENSHQKCWSEMNEIESEWEETNRYTATLVTDELKAETFLGEKFKRRNGSGPK